MAIQVLILLNCNLLTLNNLIIPYIYVLKMIFVKMQRWEIHLDIFILTRFFLHTTISRHHTAISVRFILTSILSDLGLLMDKPFIYIA